MGQEFVNAYVVRRSVFDAAIGGYLFFALYVALTQPSSEQLLNLGSNVALFFGFSILSLCLSLWSNSRGLRTLGDLIFAAPHVKAKAAHQSFLKSVWGWQLLLFLTITFAFGLKITQFSLIEILDKDGFEGAKRLFAGLATPDFSILPNAVAKTVETIFMAFIATALAIPIAFVLCFLASKNIMKGPVAFLIYTLLRTTMNVSRSIEALIWAIIFSVWVGIGPFAGMLALMIHSIDRKSVV